VSDEKGLTSAVYGDLASPAVREVGDVLHRAIRGALAPVRGALWSWEKIESWIEAEMEARLRAIPLEQIQSPAPEVAVPLLGAVAYTTAEVLRTMYANLLATAMNSQSAQMAHPAFAEIVRQMSPIDARVFAILCESRGRHFSSGAELAALCGAIARQALEVALSNIIRLGLIENVWSGRDSFTGAAEVDYLPGGSIVITSDSDPSQPHSGKGGDVERILNLTPWGDQFASSCLTTR
jgi:hypothetical protein